MNLSGGFALMKSFCFLCAYWSLCFLLYQFLNLSKLLFGWKWFSFWILISSNYTFALLLPDLGIARGQWGIRSVCESHQVFLNLVELISMYKLFWSWTVWLLNSAWHRPGVCFTFFGVLFTWYIWKHAKYTYYMCCFLCP